MQIYLIILKIMTIYQDLLFFYSYLFHPLIFFLIQYFQLIILQVKFYNLLDHIYYLDHKQRKP